MSIHVSPVCLSPNVSPVKLFHVIPFDDNKPFFAVFRSGYSCIDIDLRDFFLAI